MNRVFIQAVTMYFRKRLLLQSFVVAIIILGGSVVLSTKAYAGIVLNPDPGNWIPYNERNSLMKCDEAKPLQSPAFRQWISPATTSASYIGTVKVKKGQNSVDLRYNLAAAVCAGNSAVRQTSYQFLTGAGTSNMPPGTIINFGSDYNKKGAFRNWHYNFTYSPSGGFTKSGKYTAIIGSKRINEFNSGTFLCVGTGGEVNGILDFNKCQNVEMKIDFNVVIDEDIDHNPTGQALMDCDAGFSGWALDRDNLKAQLGIGIIIKEPSKQWNDKSNYKITFTANQPIPNPPFDTGALAKFGVGGKRGFKWLLPNSYKNNKTYHWMVIAGNASGTKGALITNIGQGSFKCPPSHPSWDVGVGVVCNIEAGTATFTFTRKGNIPNGTSVTVTRNMRLNNPNTPILTNVKTVYNNSNWPTSPIVEYSNPVAGQTMDASISVSPGGSGSSNNSVNCPTTNAFTFKPYLRAYGGDIVVGRNFPNPGSSCKTNDSLIGGYTSGVSPWAGAGGEFAVSATSKVEGFMSGNMHGDKTTLTISGLVGQATVAPSSLIFGNASTPWGRDQNGYTGCMPDFESFVTNNGGYPPSGNQTINLNALSPGARIFVDGDITISNNSSSSTTPFSSLDDIKPIIIIAKGNINIQSNVANMEGIFVALLRDDGTGGTINTCASTNQVNECNNNLTVTGSFVAKEVKFNRLKGDIASAVVNEPDSSGNIAEKFIFPPDYYLGLLNSNSSTTGSILNSEYRSIVGLPPIL